MTGPVNWQLFKPLRDSLPHHERENFTADVMDQMDDDKFAAVLERNRKIYKIRLKVSPDPLGAAGTNPAKEQHE